MSNHSTASIGPRNVVLTFVCLFLCMPASLVAADEPTPASVDFARSVAQTFSSQRQAAESVQQRSTDKAIQGFSSRLAKACQQAERALVQVTADMKLDLPATPASPSTRTALPGDGATLDRTYSLEASQELAKLGTLFAQAKDSSRVDARLKSFVSQQAPAFAELRIEADKLAQSQAGQQPRPAAN